MVTFMGYRKQRAGELEGSAYGCIKDLAGQGRYGIKRALFPENSTESYCNSNDLSWVLLKKAWFNLTNPHTYRHLRLGAR